MGRPRKWESDAERKRAARARLELTPEEEAYAAVGPGLPVETENTFPAAIHHLGRISQDDYVAHEVEITRAQIALGRLTVHRLEDGKVVNDRDERLRRSADYARWRYQSYLQGEVVSL
jgi:hypothetical protein